MEDEKNKVENVAAKGIDILDLPEEILPLIFRFLLDHNLKSASRVCKKFCFLSSPVVRKLTIKPSSISYQDILRVLHRFPSAKEIDIRSSDKVVDVLLAISHSSSLPEKLQICLPKYSQNNVVPFQSWKNVELVRSVKTLKLCFDDDNPVTRGEGGDAKFDYNYFYWLARHDSPNPYSQWYDYGVYMITSKLPNLCKIDLSHRNRWITNSTLTILSENCPNLESLNLLGCKFTAEALCSFLCNNPQVTSIDIPKCGGSILKVVKCKQAVKHLNHISLHVQGGATVFNKVLTALAESRPPLQSLEYKASPNGDCTMDGLLQLLKGCPALVNLIVQLPPAAKNCDKIMSLIVEGLPCLRHIKVLSPNLSKATLFSLVQNCKSLETICLGRNGSIPERTMRRTRKNKDYLTIPIEKNYSIRSIEISPEADIWLLKQVQLFCPKLEKKK